MSKTYTVLLQFDVERVFSVGRAEFTRHFTDVIRVINADPKLGRLRYAAVHQADVMGSLVRMDASAYGPPQGDNPRTFSFCAPCKNTQWCSEQGRCEIAAKALADAEAAVLAKRTTHGAIPGRLPPVITEDFLPEPKPPTERKRKVVKPPEPEVTKPAAHRGAKSQAKHKAAVGKGKAGGNRRVPARRK
jgi:hypothetical protein